MWPVWLIIVVAVATAAVFTITGVLLAVRVERRRHRRLLHSHHLARHLTVYHRPDLGANDSTYSHVLLPDKNLSRVQMPYGIVAIGSGRRLSTENEKDDKARVRDLHKPNEIPPARGGKGGIKRSFTGRSLYIPKTRRQKGIQKVMPCDTAQNSPLSAIIELTDSERTPTIAAEIAGEARSSETSRKSERQFSIQWPLALSRSQPDAAPTEVLSMAARPSMLMRMGGKNAASGTSGPRPLIRAVSCSSTPSSPPEDALSVPSASFRYQHQHMHGTRHDDHQTPALSLEPEEHIFRSGVHSRLPNFDVDGGRSDVVLGARSKSPTPRLQAEPGRSTAGTLRAVKPSLHSIHASFDMVDASLDNEEEKSASKPIPAIFVRDDSFKTIDATHWDSPRKFKVNKTRAGFSNRRSMIETCRVSQWRATSDSFVTNDGGEYDLSELKRPASVATANPLQWDLRGEFAKVRRSLSPLEGSKNGHKRQNCVRIANLPVPTPNPRRVSNLPEVLEDQPPRAEQQCQRPASDDRQRRTRMAEDEELELDSSPRPTPIQSPFLNLPVLTPTLVRPQRKQYIQPPTSTTLDIPRPDSDTFSHITNDYAAKHVSPRPKPLSPTARHDVRLNSTPPSERNLQHPPFDSPILPSPALKSSTLYPRKSLVKGPRGHWPTGGMGHFESSHGESPLQHKTSTGAFFISREHLESGEVDLRRSVMLMRSLNSEHRLDNYTNVRSRLCPKDDLGVGGGQQMNAGLRTTSTCASSMPTVSSPFLERQTPRAKSSGEPAPPVSASSVRARQPSNSPSTMSTGAGSIWEDDTVGGDGDWTGASPEDTPTPTPGTHLQLRPVPQPAALRPKPSEATGGFRDKHQHHHRYDVQDLSRTFEGPDSLWEVQAETKRQLLTASRGRVPPPAPPKSGRKWHVPERGHGHGYGYGRTGINPRHFDENTGAGVGDAHSSYPSPLVRNLERAVSSGRWDTAGHVLDGQGSDVGNARNGRPRGRVYTTASVSRTDEPSPSPSPGPGPGPGPVFGLGLRFGNAPSPI
ncbi:hypothetical protein PV08_02544 [Exophiala spinifera]|uniref:Uncharacterized protein n=1 Tax=Exophiala spinifera TaxID=91928 RepID=A0A0D1YSL3_9EURO|nr:uncharacterized protein PV08_02544 [Exophiala spinifera]KIW18256.1 hypothetical protein PV08_02544 [Exophiala spinifera]